MAKSEPPKDLGKLDEIDEDKIDGILWGRFGVVNPPARLGRTVIIGVEDLDRKLGRSQSHRLDLHLLDIPRSLWPRIKQVATQRSLLQASIYAFAQVGERLLVVSAPMSGRPIERALAETGTAGASEAVLDAPRSVVISVASALGRLVAQLHEHEFHGVDLRPEQLRVENGHYFVYGFDHLTGPPRTPADDVAKIIEVASSLARTATIDWPEIRSLDAFNEALEQQFEPSESTADFEFPTEPPFVGREQAMSTLTQGVSQAKIARPTAIVVEGKRGIGKSRVLREFASEQIKKDEILVLTGAWHSDSGETRGGLLNALQQLPQALSQLEPDERDSIRRQIVRATRHLGAIVTRSAPALGSVLRHAEELPQIELGGDFSRHAAVIADVIKAIGTRQRPLLLILDNIEEIDANSAAILEIVTQSQPAHYTLLVIGRRIVAGRPPPSFAYEALELTELQREDVQDLLDRVLPGEIEDTEQLGQALYDASDGLPLSVGATLRAWLEQGQLLRGTDGVWRGRAHLLGGASQTPNVRDLFAFRLVGLSDEIKEIAIQIAVFGVSIRTAYIDDIVGEYSGAIDALYERGLVVRTSEGIRFPHDEIRDLVIKELSDGDRRRRAHQTAADILTRHSAPIPQIVYHRDHAFDQATATPEASDKLSRLHVEAGRDCLDIYDLGRARWHLEKALDHSRDPEQRSVAAEALADICLLQEDIDTAVSLYTALIATSEPVAAVSVAAKVAQFLYGKSADNEAQQLGSMALEVAAEPTPSTPLGKIWIIIDSFIRSGFKRRPKHSPELRDALCRLYTWMFYVSLLDDPLSVAMYTVRARWIATELRTGSAAMIRSCEAALSTVLGLTDYADRVFNWSVEVANEARDAWAQGMVFHHWGGALLAIARYTDGQDRLDDGIAAFRETGDVSISLISMLEKAIYGRDREHSDTVLGWVDEALSTGRRNNKRIAELPLKSIKLYILARQGVPDLEERIVAQAEAIRTEVVTPMEKLTAEVQLAYACLEEGMFELAMEQVQLSQQLSEEMGGGVPEFCQEVNFVAALVLLARPSRTRADTKLLRRVVRKFKKAIKNAPRLKVFGDLLDLKLMLDQGKFDKAQHYATKIVREFDNHQNLNATRQAHQTLARSLKGSEVLAAAEHEKVARRLGRGLGLPDHVLLSDFSEIGAEVGLLALAEETDLGQERRQAAVPAAGMLTEVSGAQPAAGPSLEDTFDSPAEDVLAAWALTETDTPRTTTIETIIEPVRAAVTPGIGEAELRIDCSDPHLSVPVDSADLEILLMQMILAVRDAAVKGTDLSVHLDKTNYDERDVPGVGRSIPAGRYVLMHVRGQGSRNHTPVIGSFANCERLVQSVGGHLAAVTERGRVELLAYVPLNDASGPVVDAPSASVLVIHPETTVRESVCSALTEVGVAFEELTPAAFDSNVADGVEMLVADADTLRDIRQLQPLWSTRLVEIVRRGDESALGYELDILYYPFSMSDLRDLLDG